jgi:PAS domain S-box-containing protein
VRATVARYAVAIGAVMAGVALRASLERFLGPTQSPLYLPMFSAVLFAGWFGGFGPGILAAVLGIVAAQYFLLPPFHRLFPATLPDVVRALVFFGFSVFVTVLNESVRRSRARSNQRLRELTLETDRRKAAEDVLRHSEERLKLALDAGQIGVWDWDIVQDRIEWSDLVHDIHGLARGTFPGGLENFAKLIHPEDRDRIVKSVQAAIKEGVPYDVEFRVIHPNGDTHWVATTARVLRNEKGAAIRMLGATTDITARKRSEVELHRKNRDLEEFAFVAGHDLREPLRAVNIYTQLIIKRLGGEDCKLNQYASFVRQGITRMDALIDDLLTFSRVVLHEEPTLESADLSVSLDDALSLLQNSIRESGAVVTVEPLPRVHGNALQMTHVFQNLLANALKYRKEDVRPEIRVSAELQGNQWIISVEDNGIGFEGQFSDHIFGLFKRLHSDDYPGTGLGLAICTRIVERSGGRIWAEGRPGEGATFRFSLPRVEGT